MTHPSRPHLTVVDDGDGYDDDAGDETGEDGHALVVEALTLATAVACGLLLAQHRWGYALAALIFAVACPRLDRR
jgi:hypothetical protein